MKTQVSKFLTTRIVHHGPGALAQLPVEIARLNAARPCIVTDPGIAGSGILEQVRETLTQTLERVPACFDQVQPEPPYELVGRCVELLKKEGCDLVIGLGGGSSLDTAKMAGVMMGNSGAVTDYFGADKVPHAGLPVIAVPTTAGTGSEASPAAVFQDPQDSTKKGVRSDHLLPQAAILDPCLTLSLPRPLTASTGMDALTHAIECYTSAKATLMSDMAAEKAIELMAAHLRTAYTDGGDLSARDGMLMASYLSGRYRSRRCQRRGRSRPGPDPGRHLPHSPRRFQRSVSTLRYGIQSDRMPREIR